MKESLLNGKEYYVKDEDYEALGAGCGLAIMMLVGYLFVSWLCTIGIIWLICFLLGPFGIIFDLGMATAVWLALKLISLFIKKKK